MATVIDAPVNVLTYKAYMAEPQVEGRYDIINGVRLFMPGATYRHQRVSKNLTNLLTDFEEESGTGILIPAPYDVLIRPSPQLQTRQPDLLFISHVRAAQGGGIPENGALKVAPELVIEIISSSETRRILGDKVADYTTIGVDECWVIRPETRTVELLEPNRSGDQIVAVFDGTMPLTSRVFPRLSLSLGSVFKP